MNRVEFKSQFTLKQENVSKFSTLCTWLWPALSEMVNCPLLLMIYFTAIFMQNKKEKVRVEMVCMNSVLIDLGTAIRYLKNSFKKGTYRT